MKKNIKDILIIDQNKKMEKKYKLMLKQEGFTVDNCTGLSEAVRKLKITRFGCIIMDVDLPEMKGYNAIRIVRKLDLSVKIIVTASVNTRELETKVREQDIFYYYIKSFEPNELKLAVRNALNK